MGGDRIVAQHRMAGLRRGRAAEQAEGAEEKRADPERKPFGPGAAPVAISARKTAVRRTARVRMMNCGENAIASACMGGFPPCCHFGLVSDAACVTLA